MSELLNISHNICLMRRAFSAESDILRVLLSTIFLTSRAQLFVPKNLYVLCTILSTFALSVSHLLFTPSAQSSAICCNVCSSPLPASVPKTPNCSLSCK